MLFPEPAIKTGVVSDIETYYTKPYLSHESTIRHQMTPIP